MVRTGRLLTWAAAAVLAPALLAADSLDPTHASAGLREALGVGTTRSVAILGRLDGYLGNPDVRIPMPKSLDTIAKGLKLVGQSKLAEEFVTSMNRAAEAAAPVAKDVFLDTIKKMTFDDARGIVRGQGHEATDYLRSHSGPKLSELFRPIVKDKLAAVGATRSFDAMMSRTASLPYVGKPAFDLEAYVTEKTLDGMFLMIAREEEKIRKDPVARTTELLKSVFGAGAAASSKKPWWKLHR